MLSSHTCEAQLTSPLLKLVELSADPWSGPDGGEAQVDVSLWLAEMGGYPHERMHVFFVPWRVDHDHLGRDVRQMIGHRIAPYHVEAVKPSQSSSIPFEQDDTPVPEACRR